MSNNETGGPAFPNVPEGAGSQWNSWDMGMTLRDYFAANAMQAHVSAQWEHFYKTNPGEDITNHWDDKDIALCAYDIADAMLEARK